MMTQSNCDVLGLNFLADLSDNPSQSEEGRLHPNLYASPWYKYVLYVLQNLQGPP